MASRVDQIEFHARKLAQATGVDLRPKEEPANAANVQGGESARPTSGFDSTLFASASTVTLDLDIEALSKGLLDLARDLDHYLQTLLEPPNLNTATLKMDIARLEAELQEKDELMEKSIEMIRKAESHFRKLKARQLRNVYHM